MKFYENWNFWNLMKILNFFEIIFLENFWVFVNRGWSPSVPNKHKTFIQSGRGTKHCRSIVLKTMDRSIVKQLEKEKNSHFNVENFVVMFIYWGTITYDILLFVITFLVSFQCIIITLLPFFIEMLQYDWLWSGHMIIKEMFHIPMKLKSELARASMTTSDANKQWRSNFQQQII
jgi:hypothetical protein